jgi:hypothetical protein
MFCFFIELVVRINFTTRKFWHRYFTPLPTDLEHALLSLHVAAGLVLHPPHFQPMW